MNEALLKALDVLVIEQKKDPTKAWHRVEKLQDIEVLEEPEQIIYLFKFPERTVRLDNTNLSQVARINMAFMSRAIYMDMLKFREWQSILSIAWEFGTRLEDETPDGVTIQRQVEILFADWINYAASFAHKSPVERHAMIGTSSFSSCTTRREAASLVAHTSVVWVERENRVYYQLPALWRHCDLYGLDLRRQQNLAAILRELGHESVHNGVRFWIAPTSVQIDSALGGSIDPADYVEGEGSAG